VAANLAGVELASDANPSGGRCECKYKCPPLPERASCKKARCT